MIISKNKVSAIAVTGDLDGRSNPRIERYKAIIFLLFVPLCRRFFFVSNRKLQTMQFRLSKGKRIFPVKYVDCYVANGFEEVNSLVT